MLVAWNLYAIWILIFGIYRLRFAVIVHYLARARKAEFVTGDPLQVVGIASQDADVPHQPGIVMMERCDFPGEGIVPGLHSEIFDQPHLAEDQGRKEVCGGKKDRGEKNFPVSDVPGVPVGF